MHLEKYRSNGRNYLRSAAGKRMKDRRGRAIVGKRIVASLGPLAKYDDGLPDYLERLRASFRAGKPLIKELEAYVGEDFRCKSDIVTREIIGKYHGLTQIEDQFREMKGTLATRPVCVRTPEHVRAHLMVCFIALTMLRLIQRKTKAVVPRNPDVKWSYGIPGARVAAALRDWQVTELPGEYYQLLIASDGDIQVLLKAFGINVPARIFTKGDIRELKSTVTPF